MKKITRGISRAKKEKLVKCPTCGKNHTEHREFGPFCCASCLQTPIRPLIVTPLLEHRTVTTTVRYYLPS